MVVTEVINKKGTIDKVIVQLGTIIKETSEDIYIVFWDGMKIFNKQEYQSYLNK